MRLPRKQIPLATVVVALLLPRAVSGADPGLRSSTQQERAGPQSPARLFRLGTQEIGIAAGYGFALRFVGETGDDEELRDVQYFYVAPRWGIGISDPMGGDAWYRGNVELLAEGAFLLNLEPKDGFAGGITVMLRYNFLPAGVFIPFVEAGAGILSLDFDLMNRSDGLNFTAQAGFGFHYFVADRTAFTGEWRYHHISNAAIERPNLGINSSLFLIGLTIFLR